MRTELPPIVDDSWFLSPECDALMIAAERKRTRSPSAHAMRQTRRFGRRSYRGAIGAAILGAVAFALFAAMVIGESMGAAGY